MSYSIIIYLNIYPFYRHKNSKENRKYIYFLFYHNDKIHIVQNNFG